MWWLLLAAVVDEGRAKTSLQELSSRLGLVPERQSPGTRARLDAIRAQLAAKGWPPSATFAFLTVARLVARELPPGTRKERVFVGHPIVHPVELPPLGVRTPLDPILTWLCQAGTAELQAHFAPGFDWRSDVEEAVPELLDWIEATRPNLSQMSWTAALEASAAWHRAFSLGRTTDAPISGIVVVHFSDGARIERLLTRDMLDEEGEAMGHCVGSHYRNVANGQTAVYSYRDPEGRPKATWEIRLGEAPTLEDLEGPENEDVEDRSALARVPTWLRISKVPLGDYAPKVDQEGGGAITVPSSWALPSTKLSPEEEEVDAAIVGAISLRDTGGRDLGRAFRAYAEEVATARTDLLDTLRVWAHAEHLDEDDEARVHAIDRVDPAWTPERILEVTGTKEAWEKDGAALRVVAARAGVDVARDDHLWVYTVRFAAERALRYREDRRAVAAAFDDTSLTTKSADFLQESVRELIEEEAGRLASTIRALTRFLDFAFDLDVRLDRPEHYADVENGEFGIVDLQRAVRASANTIDVVGGIEPGGPYVRFRVDHTDNDDDSRETIHEGDDLLVAMASAGWVQSTRDVIQATKGAKARLEKHGATWLDPSIAMTEDLPLLLRASAEKGWPVPPAAARLVHKGGSGRE